MKVLSCMICTMDRTIEEKLIQRIRAFDSIEINEIVKTNVGLIEKLNRKNPDLLFINLDNEELVFSDMVKLIQKPPFIIGITNNKKQLQEHLDQGIFDFLNSKVEMEDICRKIRCAAPCAPRASSFPRPSDCGSAQYRKNTGPAAGRNKKGRCSVFCPERN